MAGPKKTTKGTPRSRGALSSIKTEPKTGLDLDALANEGEPYGPVTLGGRDYMLCDANDLDVDVAAAADSGSLLAIKAAIADGIVALDESGEAAAEFAKNRLTIRGATALLEGWFEHSGLRPGE